MLVALKFNFSNTEFSIRPINLAFSSAFLFSSSNSGALTYIIHSGFISGYQNRYGDNLKPPTNVYHRMTA
ncbi:hypothetical protein I1700191I7_04290 [Bacteroides ovatus]